MFSREQLLNHLYDDYRVVTDRTIDSHIKNLRRNCEALDAEQSFIRAVYGVGYRWEADALPAGVVSLFPGSRCASPGYTFTAICIRSPGKAFTPQPGNSLEPIPPGVINAVSVSTAQVQNGKQISHTERYLSDIYSLRRGATMPALNVGTLPTRRTRCGESDLSSEREHHV